DPAPGTSPERFSRMLDAAQYLADHIHEAPVWIVPSMQGASPTRTAGSSIYPAVQNMLLAARALGLGATLTTLYLQFEKELEAASHCRPACTRMPCCRSATQWDGSDPSALFRSPISSTKIGGASHTGIKVRQHEVGC